MAPPAYRPERATRGGGVEGRHLTELTRPNLRAGAETTRWLLVLFVFVVVVLPTGAGALAAGEGKPKETPEAAAPAVALEPCELPGYEGPARCGRLEVLEDRQGRAGREIGLRLAVLPATGEAPAKEPVFFVSGGPGQGAVPLAGLVGRLLAQAHSQHDLVLVDLRGTGGSHPLHCRLPGSDEDPAAYLGEQFPADVLRQCAESLDADPTLYTTPVAVDDLEEVRRALGYGKIHLFGLSYGSRAVLVYLRRHPEAVASAVLYGAVPTDMKIPLHHAPDAQRALDLLFDQCEADAACRDAYPGLRKKFWQVHERLSEEPAKVETTDPKTGAEISVLLDVHLFNEEIRWRLYDQEANLVPALVFRAHAGDYSDIVHLLLRLRRVTNSSSVFATGTFLSVTCSEDVPFIDRRRAEELAAGTFLGTHRVDQQTAACKVWPRGALPDGYTEPVRSTAPVLVVSGYRDPVTPPHWGDKVLRTLPNGRHVVLRQGFHGDAGSCVRGILGSFYAGVPAGELDLGCAETMPSTPFVLPDEKIEVD